MDDKDDQSGWSDELVDSFDFSPSPSTISTILSFSSSFKMSRILNRNTATRLISNYKSSISIPSARTASRSCSNPPSCLLFTSFSPRLFSTSRSIASATSSSPASSGPSSTTQTQKQTQNQGETPETGPIARYSHLVETGLLRDDEFQRSIIHKLQKLHDDLKGYQQKLPSKEEAKVKVKGGLVSSKQVWRRRTNRNSQIEVCRRCFKVAMALLSAWMMARLRRIPLFGRQES